VDFDKTNDVVFVNKN